MGGRPDHADGPAGSAGPDGVGVEAVITVPPLPATLGQGTNVARLVTLEAAVRSIHATLILVAAAVKPGLGARVTTLEATMSAALDVELAGTRQERADGVAVLRGRHGP